MQEKVFLNILVIRRRERKTIIFPYRERILITKPFFFPVGRFFFLFPYREKENPFFFPAQKFFRENIAQKIHEQGKRKVFFLPIGKKNDFL